MRRLILCLALLMVVSTIPMAMADDDHNRSHRVRTHLSGFNEVHFVAGNAAHAYRATRDSWRYLHGGKRQVRGRDRRTRPKNPLQAELQGPGRQCYTRAHSLWSAAHGWRHRGLALPDDSRSACSTCRRRLNARLSCLEGTVEGTITPDQVLAQTAQGFAAGDFDELVDAIRAGATYANVHTNLFTPGEIRGHIPGSHDD